MILLSKTRFIFKQIELHVSVCVVAKSAPFSFLEREQNGTFSDAIKVFFSRFSSRDEKRRPNDMLIKNYVMFRSIYDLNE